MIVAGGVYIESCWVPPIDTLMGSAGRAAFALVGRTNVELNTFYPACRALDVTSNFVPAGITVRVHSSSAVVSFEYPFPLSSPRILPVPLPKAGSVRVSGNTVLRFGCLEGSFIVQAKTAIFDPQSNAAPEYFCDNGSSAERLAVVLNAIEARALTGLGDLRAAAEAIMSKDSAEVVVIKDGASGAHVFEKDRSVENVPAFEAARPNKVGSGDIFSAVFAHLWGEAGFCAREAALAGSIHAAHYVATRILPCPTILPEMHPRTMSENCNVVVFGEAETTQGAWLLREAIYGLRQIGAYASPVSYGRFMDASALSYEDECWRSTDVVLALIGDENDRVADWTKEAVEAGRKVVIFAERLTARKVADHLGCVFNSDLSASIYRAAWMPR